MEKYLLKNLNDGGTVRASLWFSLVYLFVIGFTAERCGLSFWPLAALFLIGAALIAAWATRCYMLQYDVRALFAVLYLVSGVCFAAILPLSAEELVGSNWGWAFSSGISSPFARIFSEPFFLLARALGASAAFACYFARITNLLGCGAVLYAALVSLPYCRSVAAVLALLPSAMCSFATAQPLGATLAFSMLFAAFVLRVAYTKDAYVMTRRYRAALLASAVMMLLCDASCLPFALLFFMIPRDRFGDRRHYWLSVAALGVCFAAVSGLWLSSANAAGPVLFAGADRAAQAREVLAHPLAFLAAAFRTAFSEGGRLIGEFVGSRGQLSGFLLPWPIIAAVSVSLCYTTYFDAALSSRRKYILRCFGLAVALFMLVLVFSRYLSYTAVGAAAVGGLTGSLFLPAALPGALFLKRLFKHPAAPQKNFSMALLAVSLADVAAAVCILAEVV